MYISISLWVLTQANLLYLIFLVSIHNFPFYRFVDNAHIGWQSKCICSIHCVNIYYGQLFIHSDIPLKLEHMPKTTNQNSCETEWMQSWKGERRKEKENEIWQKVRKYIGWVVQRINVGEKREWINMERYEKIINCSANNSNLSRWNDADGFNFFLNLSDGLTLLNTSSNELANTA